MVDANGGEQNELQCELIAASAPIFGSKMNKQS